MSFIFGEFALDLDQRRVTREGQDVHLTPKALDLLALLVQHRPKALSKAEVLGLLWPDAFVTENSLAGLVAELRAALQDNSREPRFIRTVYGYGYAFVAAVDQRPSTTAANLPAWRLICDARETRLAAGENIVGRSGPNVVVLDSPTVSRHHARLTIDGAIAVLEDLGSKNGTWLGTAPVTAPTRLRDGDTVRFGAVAAVVRYGHPALSTDTVRPPD